ncbi:hypothetical protein [Aliikangiella sp. G2MR2-5]|uniref:hypothetical protein n=1 Tax=Aliikangiella sp. G2MR2-5 TaxID=2788943 RepID=UPI0018A88B11|nr:hypothetical protein [Aliikangiella sp. G2MR2-5]
MNLRPEEEINHLDAFEKAYKEASNELPHSDVDKQIIAAAYRELDKPNSRRLPSNSWWRRLSLPVYALGTLAFTALATKWLWNEPVRMPPGTSPGPVEIEVVTDTNTNDMTDYKPREPKKAPEYQAPEFLPESQTTRVTGSGLKVPDNGNTVTQLPEQESLASPRGQGGKLKVEQVAKLEYQTKEEWAKKIIELYKEGRQEAARKELTRFKKKYPGYPIDEQLEALRSM